MGPEVKRQLLSQAGGAIKSLPRIEKGLICLLSQLMAAKLLALKVQPVVPKIGGEMADYQSIRLAIERLRVRFQVATILTPG